MSVSNNSMINRFLKRSIYRPKIYNYKIIKCHLISLMCHVWDWFHGETLNVAPWGHVRPPLCSLAYRCALHHTGKMKFSFFEVWSHSWRWAHRGVSFTRRSSLSFTVKSCLFYPQCSIFISFAISG